MERSMEDENGTSTMDVSFDEFLPVDAREDTGELDVVENRAAEEALHTVDPFIDADDLEMVRVVADATDVDQRHGIWTEIAEEEADEADDEATDGATVEHQATVDEVLSATTEGADPARVDEWADAEDALDRVAAGEDELPEPRHGDEFLCRMCFQLKHADLRATASPDICRDCVGAAVVNRSVTG